MTIEVELNTFGGGRTIRKVEVPDDEWRAAGTEARLELAFQYGQNDFQPQPLPSVSVGDVVRLEGERWAVAPCGWERC